MYDIPDADRDNVAIEARRRHGHHVDCSIIALLCGRWGRGWHRLMRRRGAALHLLELFLPIDLIFGDEFVAGKNTVHQAAAFFIGDHHGAVDVMDEESAEGEHAEVMDSTNPLDIDHSRDPAYEEVQHGAGVQEIVKQHKACDDLDDDQKKDPAIRYAGERIVADFGHRLPAQEAVVLEHGAKVRPTSPLHGDELLPVCEPIAGKKPISPDDVGAGEDIGGDDVNGPHLRHGPGQIARSDQEGPVHVCAANGEGYESEDRCPVCDANRQFPDVYAHNAFGMSG